MLGLHQRLASLAAGVGAELWGPVQEDDKLRIALTRDNESRVVTVAATADVASIVKAVTKVLKAWPAK